jgi:hypothetical protein
MVGEAFGELGKIALQRLTEVKPEDAARAVRAVGTTTLGAAVAIPGIGAFALGVALGAGVGVLFAPRAGRETRARIRAAVRGRLAALRRLRHAG